MPYIDQKSREKFKEIELLGLQCEHPGELNYALSMLCKGYLEKRGMIKYQYLNDIMGALTGCLQEFYRKVCSDYEELKEKDNGRVY